MLLTVWSMVSRSSSKRIFTGYHSWPGASQTSTLSPRLSRGSRLTWMVSSSPMPVRIFSCLITLKVQGSASRRPATMKVHSLPGLNFASPAARATEASCQVTEARSCSPPFMT